MTDWRAQMGRDAWTVAEAINHITGEEDVFQPMRSDETKMFPGGFTAVDAEYDERLRFSARFIEIRNRAQESCAIGALKVYGEADDFLDRFVRPTEWISWARSRFELPPDLVEHLDGKPAAVVKQRLQDIANQEAAEYKKNHGCVPTRTRIAKRLEALGHGKATTIMRKILKCW